MIYQDILQEGLEQGIEQKAQEIAVNMLNQGVAIAYGGRLSHRINCQCYWFKYSASAIAS